MSRFGPDGDLPKLGVLERSFIGKTGIETPKSPDG